VLLARVLLRYGEADRALTILEDVHEQRPEKFGSSADEDAWYTTCQVLADLYLERSRADLAIPCLIEFRKSAKSGARTLFKLGQAHEMLGDRVHALRFYKQVTAYEGNPLAADAYEAMQRLQQQA
jgi:predicted Zn-dependent protease